MEIKEMTIEEVLARKAELVSETEGVENERLAEIAEELKELNARKAELDSAAEKREALIEKIEKNEIGEVKKTMENEVRTFAVDSVEYREAFFKNLMGKEMDEQEKRAITATAVIPTETMNKIWAKLENNPILAAVDVTRFPGHVTIPAESSCADANWTATASDSADALNAIQLNAYKLIKTIEISCEVDKMHIADFERYIVERLANKIERALDKAVLVGTGSDNSQPTGVCVTKATADLTYATTGVKYSDLCKCIAKLDSQYHRDACFVMPSKMFWENVEGIVDGNNKPVVVSDPQSPAKFNILGFPVIVDDFGTSNSADILFGDFKAYKLNIGSDVTVDSDVSLGFRSGTKVYRGLALADGKLADTKAIVRMTKA